MCENAMTYNLPDTVFYKGAHKLMTQGLKMMAKDKLLHLKRTLPYAANVSDSELGIEHSDEPEAETSDGHSTVGDDTATQQSKYCTSPTSNFPFNVKSLCISVYQPKPFGDEEYMEPEEIVAQAQEAAKVAADALTICQPRSTVGPFICFSRFRCMFLFLSLDWLFAAKRGWHHIFQNPKS
jgi:bromodomain-containing protein 7/9